MEVFTDQSVKTRNRDKSPPSQTTSKGDSTPLKARDVELLPPCKVCGAPASGLHFGVITCSSCKVFYRRALSRVRPYSCYYSKDCDIRPGRRVSCSYCRLNKCTQVGMSKQGVKFGRYTLTKRNDYILEAKCMQKEKKSEKIVPEAEVRKKDTPPQMNKLLPRSDRQTLQARIANIIEADKKHVLADEQFLASLPERQAKHKEMQQTRKAVFGLQPIPVDVYEDFYRNTGLDVDDRGQIINKCLSSLDSDHLQFISYAKELPGFTTLPLLDQMTLIKENRFCWWLLSIFPVCNIKDRMFTCVSCGLTFDTDEMCAFWGDDVIMESWRLYSVVNRFRFNPTEMAFLKALLVFNIDDLDKPLIAKKKIEIIYQEIMHALVYHANCDPSSHNVIPNIVTVLTEFICTKHVHKQILHNWFSTWSDANLSPLSIEMIRDPA